MSLLDGVFALVVAFFFVQAKQNRNKDIFLQESPESGDASLLVVTWENYKNGFVAECAFYSNQDGVDKILKSSDQQPTRVSEDEMQSIMKDCIQIHDEYEYENPEPRHSPSNAGKQKPTSEPGTTTPGYDGIALIFPGTKWCGVGDIASNYDDLGIHQDTDRCCRTHDFCDDTLAPGESRNNLTNNSKFIKLSCQCDNDLYSCLDRVNTLISNTIGNMYFNVLNRDCYDLDYPITNKCKKYRTFLKRKCIEYEKNTKGKKVYQWIQAKRYKKIPFPGPITVTLPF